MGWQWHRTRRLDPTRVDRHGLVLAVATLWVLAHGTRVEEAYLRGLAPGRVRTPPLQPAPVARPRPLSVFQLGLARAWPGSSSCSPAAMAGPGSSAAPPRTGSALGTAVGGPARTGANGRTLTRLPALPTPIRVAAGAGAILKARWVAVDGGYASRTFVEGVRELDLHAVGRLRKDALLRFPYTGPHERRPGRRRQFDGRFDRRDLARLACTTLDDEQVDLYHAVLHGKAWQCRARVVYVLPRGADPQTTEGVLLYSTDTDLAPERIFRLYGARFQIEFAFRDAKQHLGLHHSQARSQAKLHFHFNIVFAALFWARLQARARAERPLGPFALCHLKRHNLEKEIYERFAARSDTGRNAAKSKVGRRRIPPERLWLRAPPLEPGPVGP